MHQLSGQNTLSRGKHVFNLISHFTLPAQFQLLLSREHVICFFSVMTYDLNEIDLYFIFTALPSTSALNDFVRSGIYLFIFLDLWGVSWTQNAIKCQLHFIFSAIFKNIYKPPWQSGHFSLIILACVMSSVRRFSERTF